MKILVPTDFTPASKRALEMALELARASRGHVTLLHAFEPPVYSLGERSLSDANLHERFEAGAKMSLADLANSHAAQGVSMTWLLRSGVPEEEILVAAEEEKADLIVMASHHGKRARNGLGSVAENVIRNGRRPTLVLPNAT